MEQIVIKNEKLERIENEIITLKNQTAENMILMGQKFIEAKDLVSHGEWGKWLENKIGFSQRTANQLMRIAKEYSANSQAISNLEATKIYLLLELPMEEREISRAVITRLPRYYRYLGELLEGGVERISSNELSVRMRVTASQIRQDLNNFGGFGQQGYGYNVKYLYTEIGKILGIDRQHNLVIIGAGNLGQAIANYANFEKRGFIIKGMFDINPRLIGLVVRGIEIRGVDDLEQFIEENDVQMAALTIPKTKAPEIADRLVDAGIKAIWNFAHVDLNVPDDVVVENVHLSESLMRLSYRVCSMQDQEEKKKAKEEKHEKGRERRF